MSPNLILLNRASNTGRKSQGALPTNGDFDKGHISETCKNWIDKFHSFPRNKIYNTLF